MNDNVHALIGAYAVDAVNADERAEFEEHLGACEDCAAELATLRAAAAALGDGEAVAPPAAIRARVLEAVERTAQLPPLLTDDASGAEGPTTVADASGRARRMWPRLAVAAAAAAVLAVGGLVGSTLARDRTEHAALEQDAMMVTSAPDAHAMDLGLGASHLVMSDKMHSVVAMGENCPPPADGMEYQLWVVMEDGSKHAGPTFMPDEDGSFMTLMETDMDGVAAVAVTEEPVGGSEQPTTTAVAVAEL